MKTNWLAIVFELASVMSAMQLNGTLQVAHEQNLIWTQKDESSGTSRIVGVSGDPDQWIPIRVASSQYITAPGKTWRFQALTFNYRQKLLFWSESGHKKIQGIHLNSSSVPFDIYTGTSSKVLGLTYDWIRGNLYWTDSMYNWIVVANYNGGSSELQRVIVDTGLDQPAGIVVHPLKRKLFWSDMGIISKIETSNLIGQNRKVLVFSDLNKPISLELDIINDRLYWVDKHLNRIESIDINGKNRQLLVQDKDLSYRAISIYQNYLFVTEQSQKQLLIYLSSTGKLEVSFSMYGATPYDIVMYDIAQQPTSKSSCRSSTCDHICTEDDLGFPVCLCGHGYALLRDDSTCSVKSRFEPPQIIYTIGPALCSFPGNIPNIDLATISLDQYCFLTGQYTNTFSFNIKHQLLYMYDNNSQSISSLKFNGDSNISHSPVVIVEETGKIRSLSHDWITLNFYWIDEQSRSIVAASYDGEYRVRIIEDLEEPTSLAVNVINRKLYWTEIGVTPRIRYSDLDGDNMDTLIDNDLNSPEHITVDYVSYRLYWSDSQLGRIKWSSFDGKITHTILEQPNTAIVGISVFQDFLLWTETGDGNGLHIGLKDSGNKLRGIVHPDVGSAGSIITFDKSSQPGGIDNPCDTPPICEHICFPKSDRVRVCRCAVGYVLHKDGYSCKTDLFQDNFLLFSDTKLQQLFQMSLTTNEVNALPLSNLGNPLAVTIDPVNQKVYWTDAQFKVIKSAHLDGSNEEVVGILNKASIPDGIAVDPVTSLLYYTDGGNKLIGVFHTIINSHLTLVNRRLSKPRAIVLYIELGLMFWTDWGKQSRIERAAMDGSRRKLLVHTGRGAWPNGLTIDKQGQKIYWCDAKLQTIEHCDINGQNRRVLIKLTSSHMFGLTFLDNTLYYTDWNKRSVMTVQIDSTSSHPIGPKDFTRANGIIGYMKSGVKNGGSHPCVQHTGLACSDICIPVTRNRKVCKCPDGVQLSRDKHTCIIDKDISDIQSDKWMTNAAPHILPTDVSNQMGLWKRITTNPSLLTSSWFYTNKNDHPLLETKQDIHDLGRVNNTVITNKTSQRNDDNGYVVSSMANVVTTVPNVSLPGDNVTLVGGHRNVDKVFKTDLSIQESPRGYKNEHVDDMVSVHPLTTENRSKVNVVLEIGRKSHSEGVHNNSILHEQTTKGIPENQSPPSTHSRLNTKEITSPFESTKSIINNEPLTTDRNTITLMDDELSTDRTVLKTDSVTEKPAIVKPSHLDVHRQTPRITTELTTTHIIGNSNLNQSNHHLHSVTQGHQTKSKENISKAVLPNMTAIHNITLFAEVKIHEYVDVSMTTDKVITRTLQSTVPSTTYYNIGNETEIVSDNKHMIGFLTIICSAVVVMCVLVFCAVFIYNKIVKKSKGSTPKNNNIHAKNMKREKTTRQNDFHSQLPVTRHMNNYTPDINSKYATVKIKGKKTTKITNIQNGDIFPTDIARKYASMNDSHFTGHQEDVMQQSIQDNAGYDVDYCSDFSFDTDIESQAGHDFVTFRNAQDSLA